MAALLTGSNPAFRERTRSGSPPAFPELPGAASAPAARWSPGPTAAGAKRVTAVCRPSTTAVCRGQREHPYRARNAFTGDSQLSRRMKGSWHSPQKENHNMNNVSKDRKRKLLMLGGLGLGLAML